jgi:hypothetical protein
MFPDSLIAHLLAGAGDGDLRALRAPRRTEPAAVVATPPAGADDVTAALRLAGAAWLYHG